MACPGPPWQPSVTSKKGESNERRCLFGSTCFHHPRTPDAPGRHGFPETVAGQAISMEVEGHDDAGIPPVERLGEFATIMLDADREEGVVLCTVLLTREPGRRFVRLGAED